LDRTPQGYCKGSPPSRRHGLAGQFVPHQAGHLRSRPSKMGDMADLRLLTFTGCCQRGPSSCYRRGPFDAGGNIHAQPPVMPCLVAMTPTATRARRSVRGEIRASCACRIIHEAGIG
jgi:hypothetical protein